MKEVIETRQYNSHQIATAFHDAGSQYVVVFCHGFRGVAEGPNRLFVRAARKLAAKGVSSLRFDQYGSGNSEGDFRDSSFNDWIKTTRLITHDYLQRGYKVALFGQSMGAATVICVGADTPEVVAAVAWVPDPNVDEIELPDSGYDEEGGQLVQVSFWQEAHTANVAEKLHAITAPMYIVQCTDDEYVSPENRQAVQKNAQPNHHVETFSGYKHSAWTYNQAEDIIDRSVDFLVNSFQL